MGEIKKESIEKSDRQMFAKDLTEKLNSMKLHGKALTNEQRLRVVLSVYSALRKQIAK